MIKILYIFILLLWSSTIANGQACEGNLGAKGTCMKKAACTSAGGIDLGKCTDSSGICCQITYKCGDSPDPVEVSFDGSYLTPDFQYNEACNYVIPKQPGVCQIRLDFEKFVISEGSGMGFLGDCDIDMLVITGYTNAQLGPLCGDLTGQHMYLEYGDNDKIDINIFMVWVMKQDWNIRVTMINCNSLDKAPPGCLQYFTQQIGQVESFNFRNMHQINNQDYSICVKTIPGMKKITWKRCNEMYRDFQITGDSAAYEGLMELGEIVGNACTRDWVDFYGNFRHCGTWLTPVSVMAQPFMAHVHFNNAELIYPPPDTIVPCDPSTNDCDFHNSGFCLAFSQSIF